MIERIGFGSAPTLSRWTDRLREAYEPSAPENDYGAYIQRMRRLDLLKAAPEQVIECVISRSVEGETGEALRALDALRMETLEAGQIVAAYRLRGALLRELGDTENARESYERALDMTRPGDPSRLRLRWDLLGLRNDDLASSERDALLREEIPATPAYDFAAKRVADWLASEVFHTRTRSDGGRRVRYGVPDEVAWHNTALAVAYLTGDFDAARAERILFGQLAIDTGSAPAADQLTMVAREFLAARAADRLKRLLEARGHLLRGPLDVDDLAVNLRPRGRGGESAEPIWETLLAVISSMSPYFREETRRRLSTEMTEAAVRHLTTEDEPFVCHSSFRGARSEYAFVEAFSAVAELLPDQVERVATALLNRQDAFTGYTGLFWRVLAMHRWAVENEASARAIVEKVTATLLPTQAAWDVFRALRGIGRTFDGVRPAIERWGADQPMSVERRLEFFSGWEDPGMTPKIKNWAECLVAEVAESLEGAREDSVVHMTAGDPCGVLATTLATYEIDRTVSIRWLERLVLATANPNVYVEHKADALRAISWIVRRLGLQELREVLQGRRPSKERSRSFDESPPEALARVRMLDLRLASGVLSDEDDDAVLLSAFFDPDFRVRAAAASVAEDVVRKGAGTYPWTSLLAHLLMDSSYYVRAEAARAAVRSEAISTRGLGDELFRLVSELVSEDTPYVRQVVLYAFAETKDLPAQRKRDVVALARAANASSHAGLRRAGARVIVKFGVDPTALSE